MTSILEGRLKYVLQRNNLYEYGIETRIADECKLHRHTVGNMMRNKTKNLSWENLSKISWWLINHGVKAETLPGALFGFRPVGLWEGISGSGSVEIFMGLYVNYDKISGVRPHLWIAPQDAEVGASIVNMLTTKFQANDPVPTMKTRYVPFAIDPDTPELNAERFEDDRRRCLKLFKEIQQNAIRKNVILLGSQRVNYLVEIFVADLFGCKPFEPVKRCPKVPFYVLYRDSDNAVPSCFGGREKPPGFNGKAPAPGGTYYLNEKGQWEVCEWIHQKQDAGIVIIVREDETLQMAAFGFSGRATKALGASLIGTPDKFWPCPEEIENTAAADETNPDEEKGNGSSGKKRKKKKKGGSYPFVRHNGKEIGLFVCKVTFNSDLSSDKKSDTDSGSDKRSDKSSNKRSDKRGGDYLEELASDRDTVEVVPLDPKAYERLLL